MNTIRTVYLDSAHSVERNGVYVYDLQGGIAVPEGARVFVDNVSFTNTFSEEVTENINFVYTQTFESSQVPNLADQDFMFGYQGEPQKDLLHCTDLIATQPLLKANLPITAWTDGTTTYKFSFGTPPQRDQFVVDVNGTQHHIFCYDITPDRMFFTWNGQRRVP